jgi:hypothetical protein
MIPGKIARRVPQKPHFSTRPPQLHPAVRLNAAAAAGPSRGGGLVEQRDGDGDAVSLELAHEASVAADQRVKESKATSQPTESAASLVVCEAVPTKSSVAPHPTPFHSLILPFPSQRRLLPPPRTNPVPASRKATGGRAACGHAPMHPKLSRVAHRLLCCGGHASGDDL